MQYIQNTNTYKIQYIQNTIQTQYKYIQDTIVYMQNTIHIKYNCMQNTIVYIQNTNTYKTQSIKIQFIQIQHTKYKYIFFTKSLLSSISMWPNHLSVQFFTNLSLHLHALHTASILHAFTQTFLMTSNFLNVTDSF